MWLLGVLTMIAHEVTVVVNPIQQILPPQVALYISNPGRYFNVSITNNTQEAQQVYLGLQLEQVNPHSGLSVSTPPRRQPDHPIIVPAGQMVQLTTLELKNQFVNLPASEVSVTDGLFDNYKNGSFGLLPEGLYQAHLIAYKWDPMLATPVVLSNPNDGMCMFTVCYKAQAPEFLTPISAMDEAFGIAHLSPLNAQFTWKQPIVSCAGNQQFRYAFRVVELLPGQQPDDAIDKNPVVYQMSELIAPSFIIPINIIKSRMDTTSTYIARVEASQSGVGSTMLNYVMIENEGRSNLKFFTFKEKQTLLTDNDSASISGITGKSKHLTDSLYAFRNPTLLAPTFYDETSRKIFVDNDIPVNWRKAWYLGGDGTQSDTIKFKYEIQLFKAEAGKDRKEIFASKPFYHDSTETLKHLIKWESIKDSVSNGDFVVLRVVASSPNTRSIEWMDDSVNVKDFTIASRLTKRLSMCSNEVAIDNFTPTTLSAKELEGKTVGIGQFQMRLDQIEKVKGKSYFKGKGHVEWKPRGVKTWVCVQFDSLTINTDNIVVGGSASTYARPDDKPSNEEAIKKLFSDAGIDNLIGNSGLPYAKDMQNYADKEFKNLAEKLNISEYYKYYAKGKAIYNNFMKGEIADLYMPLQLPRDLVNKGPVDIQVVNMRFSPEEATMNLLGEFMMPESKIVDNNILLVGAPRVCMDPERVLPQVGFVSLLSDFIVRDPKSDYEMRFKAPEDVLLPENGCYITWGNDTLGGLSLDLDMKIPNLKKEVDGKATDAQPVINIRTLIYDWDDWTAQASMDAFQSEDAPGFSFVPSTVIFDHSSRSNAPGMGKFPEKYDKTQAGITGSDNEWQGFYLTDMKLQFPKTFMITQNSDKRLGINVSSLFIDKSGVTCSVGIKDPLNAGKGDDGATVGGWAFTIDNIAVDFVQSNFDKFRFDGIIDVPLLDGEIGYECNVYNQKTIDKSRSGFAYIFKVQAVEKFNMDFFLAEAKIDTKQSYLLVEAEDQPSGDTKTRVELCAGGTVDIGGKKFIEKKLKEWGSKLSLPIDISLPGIHFVNLRVANCARWQSQYVKGLHEEAAKAAKTAQETYSKSTYYLNLADNKEYTFGEGKDSLYFEHGAWSLASLEKTIGPFTFALDKFSPTMQGKRVGLDITGRINLCEDLIAASTTITIYADLDVANMDLAYDKTEFKSAELKCNFGGIVKLEGRLEVSEAPNKGYAGEISVGIKGLFDTNCKGGYFEHTSTGGNDRNYTWGYFSLELNTDIPVGPGVFLTNMMGGVYFNCIRPMDPDNPSESLKQLPTPQYGVIGVDLGTGLAAGPSDVNIVEGKFSLTVVYDSEHNRLTTFLFNGEAKALAGMVKSRVTLLYQDDDKDTYFRINITADATADGASVVKGVTGVDLEEANERMGKMSDRLQAMQAKLHGAAQEIIVGAEGGLEEAIGDKSGDTKGQTDTNQSKKAKEKAGVSASAGASIAIEFAIIIKENGTKLQKPHWHFYLGEPVKDKRCKFQLIDFKSKIVSVNIGADAYLCISNYALPNGGQLPPIPDVIQEFLDGGSHGAGVQSASKEQADRARNSSMNKFNKAMKDKGGAGVMVGASVWGFIDVDLGILYANMGAIAGFDVALQHFKEAYCTNIEGEMGYNGWYATGQLYAYLYAKMGLHIDLGFWERKFDIIDAGIGGVLKCGLPNPSWAEGQVRCKLRMFGGLVNINKKYSFECGKVCRVFYGNALDNFELFGGCSVAMNSQKEGWADEARINPRLQSRANIETQALVNSDIRVVDPTDAAYLEDEGHDSISIAALASRTFRFSFKREGGVQPAMLYEYSDANGKNVVNSRVVTIYEMTTKQGYHYDLELGGLNPNRYYKLVFTGTAKEYRGAWKDPETYDKQLHKYVEKPWSTTKEYFFCTGPDTPLPNLQPIDQITKIVFPSEDGVHLPTTRVDAYVDDVKRPNIALTDTRFKDQCYKDRDSWLRWQLLDSNGKVLETIDNEYYSTDNSLNMGPKAPFKNVVAGKNYTIRLMYVQYIREQIRTVTTERDTEVDFRDDTYSQQQLTEQAEDITRQTGLKLSDADKQNIREAVMAKKEEYRLIQGTIGDDRGISSESKAGQSVVNQGISAGLEKDIIEGRKSDLKDIGTLGIIAGRVGDITGVKVGDLDNIRKPSVSSKDVVSGDIGGRFGGSITNIIGGNKDVSGGVFSSGHGGSVTTPTLSHDYHSTENVTTGAIFSTHTVQTTGNVVTAGSLDKTQTPTVSTQNSLNNLSGTNKVVVGNQNIQIPVGSKMRFLIRPIVDEEIGPRSPQDTKPEVTVSTRDTIIKTQRVVFSMDVHAVNGDWQTGNLAYSKPFVSYRLDNVSFNDLPSNTGYDHPIANNEITWGDSYAYLYDPYAFISYLGNAAFIGGVEMECSRLSIPKVTTSQSLIYTSPLGRWEGKYTLIGQAEKQYEAARNAWVVSNTDKTLSSKEKKKLYEMQYPYPTAGTMHNISDAIPSIRQMSIYDQKARGNHPQHARYPILRWGSENVAGQDAYKLTYWPSTDDRVKVSEALNMLAAPYNLAYKMSDLISNTLIDPVNSKFTIRANIIQRWVEQFQGVYFKCVYDPMAQIYEYKDRGEWSTVLGWSALQIPWYQFAIIWGGTEENAGAKKSVTLYGTTALTHYDWRGDEYISKTIFYTLNNNAFKKSHALKSAKRMNYAHFTLFRLNCWNTENMTYWSNEQVPITIKDPLKGLIK